MQHSSPPSGEGLRFERAAAIADSAPAVPMPHLLSIWLLWGIVAALRFTTALLTGLLTSNVAMPLMAPVMAAVVDCVFWALLTPLIFRLTHRLRFEADEWLRSIMVVFALGVLLSLGVAILMNYVRKQFVQYLFDGPVPAALLQPPKGAQWWSFWFVSEFSAYVIIVAAGFAYYYLARYRMREKQEVQLRGELMNAKLDALRSQLNPHFLFNALNTISALIEIDPPAARLMVSQLSDLLRDTLESSAPEVPLQREIIFVRRYIDIMRTRFAGRLEMAEDIEPDTLGALVPQLILQPLVENAIKYGVERLEGIGLIRISARRVGDGLILSVVDNGPMDIHARSASGVGGTGLGLTNTRARLRQSYADEQSLTLKQQADQTIVEITLPYHTQPRLEEVGP